MKRVQQILSKKNAFELDISARNTKTGQISEIEKVGRISDTEDYALTIMNSNKALQEFFGSRADNMEEKLQMYQKIAVEGYANLNDLSSDLESNTTLSTINVFMLGAGINSNLVNEGLELPRTLKDKKQKVKKQRT